MKPKTNEQILRAFVKNASSMELGMARAWLAYMANDTLENPEKYGDTFDPGLIAEIANGIFEKMEIES
jgi:hypothetical protein